MAPVALHHTIEGPPDAPVLVLGNSLGSTTAMWEPQIAALAQAWRVVRFDHRGQGGSPVPDGPYAIDDLGGDVVALLDDLGLRRVAYCGLSLGGMVGMWLAINAPQRIGRLVLCCTSAHLGPAEAWDQRIDAVRAAGSTEAIADAVVGRWLTPEFIEARPEVFARLRAMLVSIDPVGYVGCCAAIRDMDQRAGLASIVAPTLVISGHDDLATPPAYQRVIADAIPGARLEVLSPAAHFANVEQPEAVTDLIRRHLEERT
jgi:3-oxoadipate enol-lactonase